MAACLTELQKSFFFSLGMIGRNIRQNCQILLISWHYGKISIDWKILKQKLDLDEFLTVGFVEWEEIIFIRDKIFNGKIQSLKIKSSNVKTLKSATSEKCCVFHIFNFIKIFHEIFGVKGQPHNKTKWKPWNVMLCQFVFRSH